MKKIKAYVLSAMILTILCFLFSCFVFFYYAARPYPAGETHALGDIHADFHLTWADAEAIQELCRENAYAEYADLNADGIIDNEDTAILLLYLSGHDTWSLKGLADYCLAFQNSQE